MGFNGLDDVLYQTTELGRGYRVEFSKDCGPNTLTAGIWYDFTQFDGSPAKRIHGDLVTNGTFNGGMLGWTPGNETYWTYTPASGLITHAPGNTEPDTLTQNVLCSSGISYSVAFTVAGYAGTGTVTASLGGTAGTARSSSATFRENIACGATTAVISGITYAPLTLTVGQEVACTLDNISVIRPYAFTPYRSTDECGTYFGETVTSGTCHIVNFGVWGEGSMNNSYVLLVDILGVYPRIPLSVNASNEIYLTNEVPLPRYQDGDGVQAFLAVSEAPGTTAAGFSCFYTNSDGVMGRGLGGMPYTLASQAAGKMLCCSTAQNQYGPFLPWYPGDNGIRNITSIRFSGNMAAGAGAIATLVLCRPICQVPYNQFQWPIERNMVLQEVSLPEIKPGAWLGYLFYAGAGAVAYAKIGGYFDVAWGSRL